MTLTMCDVCPKPGRCCKGFNIHRFIDDKAVMYQFSRDPEEANAEIAVMGYPFVVMGYPFVVMGEPRDLDWPADPNPTRAEPGRAFWRLECPKVTPEGWCGIYADRPDICRSYVPGTEALCVFHSACPDWIGDERHDHLVGLVLANSDEITAVDAALAASGDNPADP